MPAEFTSVSTKFGTLRMSPFFGGPGVGLSLEIRQHGQFIRVPYSQLPNLRLSLKYIYEQRDPQPKLELVIGRLYRHIKGQLVEIQRLALDHETKELSVLYEEIDDRKRSRTGRVWVRPATNFSDGRFQHEGDKL